MSKAARYRNGCSGKSGPHPADTYVGGLAPGSQKFVRGALERIARFLSQGRDTACSFDWSRLRYQDAEGLRQHLMHTSAPRTARNRIALFRGLLSVAHDLKKLSFERYHELIRLKKIPGNARVRPTRALPLGEIEKIFSWALAQPEPRASRDAALIAMLYGSGIRRGECVRLLVRDYVRDTGEVLVRMGKGRDDRVACVPTDFRSFIERWLSHRPRPDEPLFVAIDLAGRLCMGPVTPDAIGRFCRRAAERAGIPHFTAHCFRKTFTTELLLRGVDPLVLAGLLGHANVQTTMVYDGRGEAAKREAVEALTRKP